MLSLPRAQMCSVPDQGTKIPHATQNRVLLRWPLPGTALPEALGFPGVSKGSCLPAKESSLTLCSPVNCSPPGSSIHGISQTGILEWVAISFFRGSSLPRDQTRVSCLAGRFFTTEPPGKPITDNQNSRGRETLCIGSEDRIPFQSVAGI